MLYLEFETVLKFYNLEACFNDDTDQMTKTSLCFCSIIASLRDLISLSCGAMGWFVILEFGTSWFGKMITIEKKKVDLYHQSTSYNIFLTFIRIMHEISNIMAF